MSIKRQGWSKRSKKGQDMVKHILSNGEILTDITGHVVRMADAPAAYAVLDAVRERGTNGNDKDVSEPERVA